VLQVKEGAWGPLSVPREAGAPLWGGPKMGDGGVIWLGVPLGLQEPLLLGVTGYRYSQVIKSIN